MFLTWAVFNKDYHDCSKGQGPQEGKLGKQKGTRKLLQQSRWKTNRMGSWTEVMTLIQKRVDEPNLFGLLWLSVFVVGYRAKIKADFHIYRSEWWYNSLNYGDGDGNGKNIMNSITNKLNSRCLYDIVCMKCTVKIEYSGVEERRLV